VEYLEDDEEGGRAKLPEHDLNNLRKAGSGMNETLSSHKSEVTEITVGHFTTENYSGTQ